jgi:succinate dehydrogenase flavin-adding protein (antitoxin of CptAB toxin-antitoxin module)
MLKSAVVEKKKILFDGVEIPGLISVQELKLTKATVKVPSFKKLRQISSEIIEIPVIELKYACHRGTVTDTFFSNFFFNAEVKDVIEERTDQYGTVIQRRLWQLCECNDYQTPKYDAEAPELMTAIVQLIPWDIKLL